MSGFDPIPTRKKIIRIGRWWLPAFGDDTPIMVDLQQAAQEAQTSIHDWLATQQEALEARNQERKIRNLLILGGTFALGYFVGKSR